MRSGCPTTGRRASLRPGQSPAVTIEWLSDNGSCYLAGETRSFARDIGLEPRTTPIESPQSNGMAEAFVRTIKRDYVRVSPCPDANTVMQQLSTWINHYNEVHPHKGTRISFTP
jgi:putative transposase